MDDRFLATPKTGKSEDFLEYLLGDLLAVGSVNANSGWLYSWSSWSCAAGGTTGEERHATDFSGFEAVW